MKTPKASIFAFSMMLSLLILVGYKEPPVIVRRAAFDVGSSSTKMKVADVDTIENKIVRILYEDALQVRFSADLSKPPKGKIGDEVQEIGLAALNYLVLKAKFLGAKELSAVGTAALRRADNRKEFVDRVREKLGLKINIITQEEEGRLGFLAALSSTQVDPNSLIVWDIGGGSFQMIALEEGRPDIYRGQVASIYFRDTLIKKIQKKKPSPIPTPNPISREDARQALLLAREIARDVPEDFRARYDDEKAHVIGVGGVHIFIQSMLDKYDLPYTPNGLYRLLDYLLEKTDEDLGSGPYASTMVADILFVLGNMEELGIQKVNLARVNNSTALLVTPDYWE